MAEVRSEIEEVVAVPRDGDADDEFAWCFLWDCLERTLGMYSEMRLPWAEGGVRFEAPTMLAICKKDPFPGQEYLQTLDTLYSMTRRTATLMVGLFFALLRVPCDDSRLNQPGEETSIDP